MNPLRVYFSGSGLMKYTHLPFPAVLIAHLPFQALGFELPSCQSLGIALMPYNVSIETHGTPPFYMLGHEVGGTSRMTHIGDNETSLVWTVDHPVGTYAYAYCTPLNPHEFIGTQLMLNVVDAQGSSGGIPPQLFTVVSKSTIGVSFGRKLSNCRRSNHQLHSKRKRHELHCLFKHYNGCRSHNMRTLGYQDQRGSQTIQPDVCAGL
jgi:hypothetical protein